MVPIPIVFLIFISSNYPQGPVEDPTVGPPKLLLTTEKETVEDNQPHQQPQIHVNDLTAPEIKFPDESSGQKGLGKKIIIEKVLPEEKGTKGKTPVPLYSLVKNECGEGYALDENGICQKAITVRNGKTFDSDRKRRRKRHIPDFETLIKDQSFLFPFNWFTAQAELNKKLAQNDFGKVECNKLYPGLVSDGAGGCTKLVDPPLEASKNL